MIGYTSKPSKSRKARKRGEATFETMRMKLEGLRKQTLKATRETKDIKRKQDDITKQYEWAIHKLAVLVIWF